MFKALPNHVKNITYEYYLWLPSKFALVNSKKFRREVKDDRCYLQESLYSQDNNLVQLTKADDRRITRMKT